jgi:hypothetical protein
MRFGMLFLGFLLSCSDKGITSYNSSPEIIIQSHGDGTEIVGGDVLFRAQASDPNHDTEELEVRWFLAEEERCPWATPQANGESECSISLAEGTHRIVVEVRDIEQAGGRAEISVIVSQEDVEEIISPPTLEVFSPTDGSTYVFGEMIPFQAVIFYDGVMSGLSFNWSSNLDGTLPLTPDGSGLTEGEFLLSEGIHALTLVVSDGDGGLATDTRVVTINPSNNSPQISSFSLFPQPLFTADVLTANVVAQDAEEDEILLSAVWSVDGTPVHTESQQGGNGAFSLDGSTYFDKNQSVMLSVTASDAEGESVQNAQVMVSNSLPMAPDLVFQQQDGIEIVESNAGVDDIRCVVDTPSADLDGDPITYTIVWEEGGVSWQGSTSTTVYANDTIPAGETMVGQFFSCTVTPNDGEGDGASHTIDISVTEVPQGATIDTLNYNGMTYYPLHLDQCTPNVGMCCSPTTTQEQMDAFCQLAGYATATSWVMQTIASTNCYCWGGCSGYTWFSNCCSGQDNRNFITSVDCQ